MGTSQHPPLSWMQQLEAQHVGDGSDAAGATVYVVPHPQKPTSGKAEAQGPQHTFEILGQRNLVACR